MESNYNSLIDDIKVLITSFLAPADLYHLLQVDNVFGQTSQVDVDALIHQCKMNSQKGSSRVQGLDWDRQSAIDSLPHLFINTINIHW